METFEVKLSKEQDKRIKDSIDDLAYKYYAVAPILNLIRFKGTKAIPTAAVDKYGRGLFNPEFLDSLPDNQLKTVIMHESFHVLLDHIRRTEGICKTLGVKLNQSIMTTLNIIQDAYINDNLENSGFAPITTKIENEEGIPEEQKSWVDYQELKTYIGDENFTYKKFCDSSVEDVFYKYFLNKDDIENMLNNASSNGDQDSSNSEGYGDLSKSSCAPLKSKANKNNSDNGKSATVTIEMDSNSGSPSDGKNEGAAADNSGERGTPQGNDEDASSAPQGASTDPQDIASKSNDLVHESMTDEIYDEKVDNQTQNDLDKTKDCARQKIQKGSKKGKKTDEELLKQALSKNNVNVFKLLDKFTYNVSGRANVNKTWRRPNKRYRDIYPYTKGRMKNSQKDIIFSIDVSGSMDKEKISKAVSLMYEISKKYSVDTKYMFFSDSYSPVYKLTSIQSFIDNLKQHQGGGTLITAALAEGEVAKEANGIVIISDMEFGSEDIVISSVEKLFGDNYILFNVGFERARDYYNVKDDNWVFVN